MSTDSGAGQEPEVSAEPESRAGRATVDEVVAAAQLEWHEPDRVETGFESLDQELALRNLRRVRTIVQLHRPLPLDDGHRKGLRAIETRAFDPSRDREALLEVNNASFAWHPEQGNWDLRRLDLALGEPWVDLRGILVHDTPAKERTAGVPSLDGFCWTRVHRGADPESASVGLSALGEIWVIGADPSAHRTGLGRALVVAGIDHLSDLGLGEVMLYTEADNVAAVTLYDHLGFTVQRLRGGYRADPVLL